MGSILEILASLSGLAYILFIITKKPIAWLFGIISSLLYIKISIDAHLYIQSVLQGFYVLIGVLGFIKWQNRDKNVSALKWKAKFIFLITAVFLSLILAFFTSITSQKMPFLDAFIAVFGVLATYLTTEKEIDNWIIWLIINLLSAILFLEQGLFLSAVMYWIYFMLSIYGVLIWKKELNDFKTA